MNLKMFKRLKDALLGDKNLRTVYRGNDIHNEIINCFNSSILDLSIGERMLYATSFNILLHPQDYKDIEQTFLFLVKEVAKQLEKIIDKQKLKKKYSDFEAPSKNWFFQFSPCQELVISENGEDRTIIERGHPYIMGSLYSITLGGNIKEANKLKMSIKPKNSDTYASFDINPNAFRGIDPLGTGIFTVKIKNDLQPQSEMLVSSSTEIYAELKFNQGAKTYTFQMMDKEIIIAKKSEGNTGKTNILQIDDPNVIEGHARIKFDAGTKTFSIAAFDYVRVDETKVPVSSGGNINWLQLSEKANILIGSSSSLPVTLEFRSIK